MHKYMNILIHFTDIPLSSRGGFTFVYERYLKEKKKKATRKKKQLFSVCVWHMGGSGMQLTGSWLVCMTVKPCVRVCVVSQATGCSKSETKLSTSVCRTVKCCVYERANVCRGFAREKFPSNPKRPQWRRLCLANPKKRNKRNQMETDLFRYRNAGLKATSSLGLESD